MLKNTETEKHRLFCHIFIVGVILIGEGGAGPPALTSWPRLCLSDGPWHSAIR